MFGALFSPVHAPHQLAWWERELGGQPAGFHPLCRPSPLRGEGRQRGKAVALAIKLIHPPGKLVGVSLGINRNSPANP
jgi:hypothetical protein